MRPVHPGDAAAPAANAAPAFVATRHTRKKRRTEQAVAVLFGAMAVAILVPLVLILACLVARAWPSLSWKFLTGLPERGMRDGGIWPALVGTLYLVVFSRLVSTPIGVLAGIYLNEFARDNWFTRVVNLAVVNLAGVPSIVHGLFGVGAFVVFAGIGKSVLAAALTLGIMTLPVTIVATKEALGAVPMAFRTACWNLGASKWQTIRTIVLPNSLSGILTGVILEVCRAAGETAPVMFTGAVFYKAFSQWGFFLYSPKEQCMALSYHLHTVATQVQGVPESMMYATAVVLVGFVLVFNSFAVVLRMRMRAKKKW
ncbi:MAG: phosphate ABC transporter permease PstA [Kiritimatiellae bacterium]|nr:phosphate ABC transporter permease PstA [Kiritimatiellia bacterium]